MEKNMNKIMIPNTELKVSQMGLGTVDAGVRWGKEAADADAMFGTFVEQEETSSTVRVFMRIGWFLTDARRWPALSV